MSESLPMVLYQGNKGNDKIDGGADNDKCRGGEGTNTITHCEVQNITEEEDWVLFSESLLLLAIKNRFCAFPFTETGSTLLKI